MGVGAVSCLKNKQNSGVIRVSPNPAAVVIVAFLCC